MLASSCSCTGNNLITNVGGRKVYSNGSCPRARPTIAPRAIFFSAATRRGRHHRHQEPNTSSQAVATTMITSFFAPKSKRASGIVPSAAPSEAAESSKKISRSEANQETDDADNGSQQDSSRDNKRQRLLPSSSPAFPISELSPEVKELLSYLNGAPTDTHSWYGALCRHTSSPSFANLAKFVIAER